MNIYEVMSETLYDYESMDYGPPEPYCIAHLVAAKSPSQARYLAWRAEDESTYDLSEIPAFSVHICIKDVNEKQVHIVTNERKYRRCWRDSEVSEDK